MYHQESTEPEPQVDERGLVVIDGRLMDPETGEVLEIDENLYASDDLARAAKAASFRYLSLDGQIAHAKEREKWWKERNRILKNRRTWFDNTIGKNIIAHAKEIRAGTTKLVEVGQVVVQFGNSANGSIKVINRKEEKKRALDWMRAKCKAAVVAVIGEKIEIKSITPEVRKELFEDPANAKLNGFEVKPPGERFDITTAVSKGAEDGDEE